MNKKQELEKLLLAMEAEKNAIDNYVSETVQKRVGRHQTTRAERRKDTFHKASKRREMAKYADDEIRLNSGKVVNTGYRSYGKGAKLYKREKLVKWEPEAQQEELPDVVGYVTRLCSREYTDGRYTMFYIASTNGEQLENCREAIRERIPQLKDELAEIQSQVEALRRKEKLLLEELDALEETCKYAY